MAGRDDGGIAEHWGPHCPAQGLQDLKKILKNIGEAQDAQMVKKPLSALFRVFGV